MSDRGIRIQLKGVGEGWGLQVEFELGLEAAMCLESYAQQIILIRAIKIYNSME